MSEVAERAKQFYESQLKTRLEATHRSWFVAIEPISQAYFLAEQSVEACLAAKRAYRDRTSFLIRIGSPAAFYLPHMEIISHKGTKARRG